MEDENTDGGRKILLALLAVWLVSGSILAVIFSSINVTGQGAGSILFVSVMLGGMFAFIAFCFLMLIASVRVRKAEKRKKKERIAAGVRVSVRGTHVAGLQLPKDMLCDISEYGDKIVFQAGNGNFSLAKEKIADICLKSDVEIRENYVSSIGGAVSGALLFGPLGAIVGGRIKKKKDRSVTMYLIFTYLKNGVTDWISFDVTSDYWKAGKICDNFRTWANKAEISVEL